MTNWETYRIGSADQRDYTVAGVPAADGVTVVEAYWTLKASLADPDFEALVFLTIDSQASEAGIVKDAGAGDGSGLLLFIVGEDALLGLDPDRTYFRSIKVRLSDGRYSAPREGADAPVRLVAAGVSRHADTPSTGVVGGSNPVVVLGG